MIALEAPVPHAPEPGTLVDTVLCFDITVAWVAVPLLCAAVTLRGAFAAGRRSLPTRTTAARAIADPREGSPDTWHVWSCCPEPLPFA